MTPLASSAPNPRIVIVEDHDGLREELGNFLVERGADVVGSAGTVADGIDLITRECPDFAVVDNALPDGRGTDLCATVHERVPRVRVIIHSGMVTVDDMDRAELSGAAAVVPKSIRGHELLRALGLSAGIDQG